MSVGSEHSVILFPPTSGLKVTDVASARRDYLQACAVRRKFPSLIAGFDLVGHEDGGLSLSDFAEALVPLSEDEHDPLPLVLHAGETVDSGTHADHNLFDAIAIGTRRIGHG